MFFYAPKIYLAYKIQQPILIFFTNCNQTDCLRKKNCQTCNWSLIWYSKHFFGAKGNKHFKLQIMNLYKFFVNQIV